jgi:hypothetical protein
MLGKITRDGLISLDSISVSARSDAVFFDDERYGNSAGIKWDETAQGYRVDAANRDGSGLLGTYSSLGEAVAEAQNFLKNSRGDNNGGGNGGTPTPTPDTSPTGPSVSTPEPTPIEPPSELDSLPSPEGTLAQRFINKAKERLFAVNEQRGTGQVAGVTDNNFDGVDPDGVPLSYEDLIAKGWRPKKAAQIEHAAKNRKSALGKKHSFICNGTSLLASKTVGRPNPTAKL